jgi:hypothetical protein
LEVFAPRQFAILPAPILLAVLAFCLTCALVWLNVVQALAPAQVAVLVNKRDPEQRESGRVLPAAARVGAQTAFCGGVAAWSRS